ncbi:glycosyltransferase [Croceicoccus estronivorus]|uniref:glycosyltransferase n=1 Tax=Croceicoccus estronivorus TaxID=1172626 RepID=UPI000A7B3186|nr:glycosyltransferase [Croceicoccus estronivorus]
MTKPHRVLSLSTLYPNPANPRFGTFVARSLEALAARGDWEVTVISPIGLPPVIFGRYQALAQARSEGIEHGIAVYRPCYTLIPRFGGRFNPAAITRAVLPLVRRLHAERPFDLVDAQFFYPDGPAAAQIAAALNLPLSIKARGADISYWGKKPYALRKMLKAARQAGGLLAVSEALAHDMASIGFPHEKTTIHYTGLDRTLFHPRDKTVSREKLFQRFKLAVPSSVPLLATVGALIPRKGQYLVIHALSSLPDAHLLLAGTGEAEASLRTLAAEAGLSDRVHFLGSLDHETLPLVLSAADVMVLPSASEGLANAWVEALACGTPIVISDAGGAKELVRDDSAGQIVARDPQAIAEAVQTLLATHLPPQKVAENAAAFSWEANAAALATHYESLLRTR